MLCSLKYQLDNFIYTNKLRRVYVYMRVIDVSFLRILLVECWLRTTYFKESFDAQHYDLTKFKSEESCRRVYLLEFFFF